jgi:hypothetical protein
VKSLPPRQGLPEDAFIPLDSMKALEAVEDKDGQKTLRIACLSYGWLTPQHPDPKKYHLGKV